MMVWYVAGPKDLPHSFLQISLYMFYLSVAANTIFTTMLGLIHKLIGA